jgi:glycosyltransferase involved in cell wall biosynthesis
VSRLGRRVIHLASGREWRGGQNQVLLLARALAARPSEIEQIAITGRRSLLATRLEAEGVPVGPVGWHAGLSLAALAGTIREVARGPALIHAHDAHALSIAGVAGILTGTPYLATRRVDFPLRRPALWRRAERIIAISEAVRGVLLSDGIPPERVVRVHSGIDLEAVRRTRSGDIRARLGLPESGPLAVAVGALVGHKDHATLIDAAAALRPTRPELHWVIAGEGPLRGALEARIAAQGLGDRVHLPGHMPEPLRLIAAADVFVMSSREEGLGTSVLDAMALDVPIAATRAGGIPEMLDPGAGLLCPPGDSGALAGSVARILDDPALRASLIGRAQDRVEEFSATAMAEGVLAVYRSIVETVDLK